LFGLSAVVDADKFIAAREGILEEVEKMKNTLVPNTELPKG